MTKRTLSTMNMDEATKAGVQFSGDPGVWVCIGKAWNEEEGWMKSTKVLEVPFAGCFLQVTTQIGDQIAEAVTWAPGLMLTPDKTKLQAVMTFPGHTSSG